VQHPDPAAPGLGHRRAGRQRCGRSRPRVPEQPLGLHSPHGIGDASGGVLPLASCRRTPCAAS
jgi:hypothetical protein